MKIILYFISYFISFAQSQDFPDFILGISDFFGKSQIIVVTEHLDQFQSHFQKFQEFYVSIISPKDLKSVLSKNEDNLAVVCDQLSDYENIWKSYDNALVWIIPKDVTISSEVHLRLDSLLFHYELSENKHFYYMKETYAVRNVTRTQEVGYWDVRSKYFHVEVFNHFER